MNKPPILIDVIGQRCPIPVQKTRNALKKFPEGTKIHIFGDDPESLHDIPILLVRMGIQPAVISSVNNNWRFEIVNSKIIV